MITRTTIEGRPCLVADLAPGTVKILFDDGEVRIATEQAPKLRESAASLRKLMKTEKRDA